MRPRDHIFDVYGSFAREHGGWLAVGDLITLMSELEIDEQAVRSATSRMKASGLLLAERVEGRAGYSVSPQGRAILDDGDRRIFVRSRASDDPSWILALFSVPETERKQRYLIRSRLQRLGFAPGPAASWIAPAHVFDETDHMLERTGLAQYVTIFHGAVRQLRNGSDGPIGEWDFDLIREMYDEYLAHFGPLALRWADSPGTDREAFVHFMNNTEQWRPLPYADPRLPDSVTPDDWPGDEAREVFAILNRQLHSGAQRFYDSVLA